MHQYMNLSDHISLRRAEVWYDSELAPREDARQLVSSVQEAVTDDDGTPLSDHTEAVWTDLGKCVITPNSSAAKTRGNDGRDYIYAYEVYMRKPKDTSLIPRDNDIVRIRKSDGSVDKECRVAGFATLRNWVKLWL